MRKMKDSGIEWIGEIPEDWEVCKLKYLAKVQTGNTPSMTNENLFFSKDNGIPWIKAENLNSYNSIEKTEQYLTVDGIKEGRLFPKNTVFVCCIASVGKVGFSCIEASCNQQINGLSFNDRLYWKYGFYLSKAQEEEYLLLSSGNVVKILNSERQKNIFCTLPPLSEQQQIADFLDEKVSQIDSTISKTRESIEEYKKLKQSIITEAVSGKVKIENGKVKGEYDTYKDSGLEWIGEIPEEWEVKPIKALFSFGKGLPITKEKLIEAGVSVISYGQIHSKNNIGTEIRNDLIRYVDKIYYETNPQSLVSKGDFIFADTSEDLEGCGNFVYVNREEVLFAGYHTIILFSKEKKDNEYLAYLFQTDCWRSQIRCSCSGVKLFSISRKILGATSLIIPPLSEQQQIADYLDQKCSEIDNLITKKEQLVVELETYKKSLIYEVVTGKREI